MTTCNMTTPQLTIGFDLGTRYSELFAITAAGEVVAQERVATTRQDVEQRFEDFEHATVVIEAGPVTMWIKELLESLGHAVIVANPREVALIYGSRRKTDKNDAENLARLGRLDAGLLHPIKLRDSGTQSDLVLIRTRGLIVAQRTELITHMRSMCRSFGYPLPSCDAHYFHRKVQDKIPEQLAPALKPALEQIENLTRQIQKFDKRIDLLAKEKYPESKRLTQIQGVGTLTALAFMLTLGDPTRFEKSRRVGSYLGLVPRLDVSCGHNPQLRITKAGDRYLRHLLVHAAHYILGRHGQDCDLRRHGLKICRDDRNKNAKKRAVVAVARKLAVLLHRLWVSGEPYDPFYTSRPSGRMKAVG